MSCAFSLNFEALFRQNKKNALKSVGILTEMTQNDMLSVKLREKLTILRKQKMKVNLEEAT